MNYEKKGFNVKKEVDFQVVDEEKFQNGSFVVNLENQVGCLENFRKNEKIKSL